MRVRRGAVSHAPAGVDSPPTTLNCLAPSDAPARRTLQLFCVMSGETQPNQRSDGVVIIDSTCYT
eukprot:517527-Pelagomonas_calceolata.AAC.1